MPEFRGPVETPAGSLILGIPTPLGAKLFITSVLGDGFSWFDPVLEGDLLQINMNGSSARLSALLLGGDGVTYDVYGLRGDSWF